MLLTVLIPSRNRPSRLRPLVVSLLNNFPVEHQSEIEIVILDNCSDKPAIEILAPYACDMLRVVRNERFVPTSEENVFNGIKYARGEYIWFLGDDDIPRYEALDDIIKLLEANAADLFISNFRVIDEKGRLATSGQVRGLAGNLHAPLVSILKRIGIVNAFSGWSTIVARRETLDTSLAYEVMSNGAIYSHSFWLIECFADKRACFVSRPLVDYRIFHQTEGWQQYTNQHNVGYLHQWHLGLVRHYARAMARGLLTARDVAETLEYRHNGTRYRAIDEIVFKLIEQADVYMRSGLARDLLTPAQLLEAIEWLLKVDLSLQDILAAVERMYNALWDGGHDPSTYDIVDMSRSEAVELIGARARDLFSPFFVAKVHGYSIYEYGDFWIGIRTDAEGLIDSVFAQVEPRAMAPSVLVEKTRRDLDAAINRAPGWPEPVGERPPLISMALLDGMEVPAGQQNQWFGRIGRQLLEAADRDVADAASSGFMGYLWVALIAYRRIEQQAMMKDGWSHPEETGIWSLGCRSTIGVSVPTGTTHLCIEAHTFAPAGPRRFCVGVNGNGETHILNGDRDVIRLSIAAGAAYADIEVLGDGGVAPISHGGSFDTRALGLFVHRIWAERNESAERKPMHRRWLGRLAKRVRR